jgi:hypothetical protein
MPAYKHNPPKKKKESWVSKLKGKVKRRFRAEAKMKKETAQKKRYAEHYKKAGPKHAMTYAQWLKKGEEQVYFKGVGGRKKTVETQLREAGVSSKRFKKKGY